MTLSPVVLDNGTGSIKCGCAGVSPLPLLVCPTVTGRPRVDAFPFRTALHSSHSNGAAVGEAETGHRAQRLQRDILCGDELDGLHEAAELTYPITNGVIRNMDDMQELWDYVLCQRLPQMLGTAAGGSSSAPQRVKWEERSAEGDRGLEWLEGRPLLLTETPNLSLKQRCAVMEVFFEDYHFNTIQSTPQGVLTLFANGVERGVAVECGEGLTHCTPVYDGCVLTTAQRRVDLGGRAVTDRLEQLLCAHQRSPRDSAMRGGRRDVYRRLKERYCYVSFDRSLDQRLLRETNALQCTCVLPDGVTCRLGAERFTAPEVLFDPSLMDVESPGISAVLWDCIEAADVDVRRSLYESILLSGGSTLFPGFGARLTRDMKEFYLTEKLKGDVSRMARCPIQVQEPPRRQCMAYMGGALVAELSADRPEMWMSRKEYEDGGTSAVVARYTSAGGY
ncbi:putative actin-related protein 2 [Leptomonas pyrrhocoris]|uniref:Putative actin-related protein 2 n=1 Tax=Leptomonas pyrrhocoris TaxID=157538 RepID=A0A0M9G5Z1_LEPPY|nr:putative actin-related protein 2 [Leptomonas pyrrhocoris]KPA82889.1 putative actin-related protein 2 [Leptomonas pyrrhocoris]|eukprot:XP_015661328.1 putative actin-related protein 2 [Leptomonas pyrrhocoris]